MASTLKGGKTPPLLLEHLNHYSPTKLPSNAWKPYNHKPYNILTQLQLFDDELPDIEKVSSGACPHKWTLQRNQTSSLEPDTKAGSTYTAKAICLNCRCHVELAIDFRNEAPGGKCPTADAPLHHFIYTPDEDCGLVRPTELTGSAFWMDTQKFRCSSSSCSAQLLIRLRSPRLTDNWVILVTNKVVIKTRAEEAMSEDPSRFEGHAVPSAIEVISTLRAYINNTLSSPEPRRIRSNNKKWLLCLGDSCAELLEYLGFSRTETEWSPPCPDLSDKPPYTAAQTILLDDVDSELMVLLHQMPEDEKRMAKLVLSLSLATPNFERILGSKDYKRSSTSRTLDLTKSEHPFYEGLGARADFHDDLLIFGYERQLACDPLNESYYLECLQCIANGRIKDGRDSENLQTKVAIEASSGKVSMKDIREAYRSFGLRSPWGHYDDETVIGMFQSRIADAPRQESDLRRALNIIGLDRGSASIQHVASNTVTTYEQALTWLSATEDMDDSFLFSMYSIKVQENSENEDLARHCVALIAEKRKSSALKTWLETGELGEVEMEFGQAYMRLGIENKTIDDEMVLSAYNFLTQDAPSQIKDLKAALSAIAKSRKSAYLQSFLDSGGNEHMASTWPVGLENIGNTCYLNSLLQFYFTIKPLRNLVLNFDNYKMQLDDGTWNTKQVGSRKVSRKEVDRAQHFLLELQKLFRSMITVPNNTVTPEQELARLTLISSTTEETIRRNSILSAQQPSLGDISGVPVHGPLSAAAPAADSPDTVMDNGIDSTVEALREAQTVPDDEVSSEGTLVEAPAVDHNLDSESMIIDTTEKSHQQEQIFEDKENLAPTKEQIPRPSTPENDMKALIESSPSRANEQGRPQSPTKKSTKNPESSQIAGQGVTALPSPPNRPPPVPPRQKPEEQKRALQVEVEFGAQQDVTEVIANVLFQLQCAIKAESIDEAGEQIDQIKKLFFGKQKSYTTNGKGEIRSKEEYISDIKVDVASGPRDIYAALDGAFDVQQVEVGGSMEPQYAAISQLPPVLQILVQRAQFDPKTMTSFKSINHLELKETIYMDRYMDSSDPDLLQRRKACWEWKNELSKLEARRKHLTRNDLDLQMPEVLRMTAEFLKKTSVGPSADAIKVKPELVEILKIASERAEVELQALEDKIKSLSTNISSQFADLRELPYRLHSVFIHRGQVSAGHYWIYIFDFANSLWRKYNDGYVTEVLDTSVIFEPEQSNRPATPYFLVYVKDDLKSELVEAVCRDVAEPLHDSQGDTFMADDARGTSNMYHLSQNSSATEGVLQTFPAEDEWGTGGTAYQPGFW